MTRRVMDNFKKLTILFVLLLTVVSLCPNKAAAVAPDNIITYQGRLLDADGVPVADTSLNMVFTLYSADGSCLWSNSSTTCATTSARAVTLTDGLFTENLGDTTLAPQYAAINSSVFSDNASVFLEVIVGGETLIPRKRITATAYAVNSQSLDGLDSSAFLRVSNNLSDLGDVGTARTNLGLGALALLGSVDISDNTNLVAGTNITLDGDTLNVDDAFLLNNGDTATGLFDFTGAVFSGTAALTFEGASADDFETAFSITDPTADNLIAFKNASGTVAFTSDIPTGAGLWEVGTNGTYEDDAAVIVGSDAVFTHASGATGDLRISDELEVIGNSYFDGSISAIGQISLGDNGDTFAVDSLEFDVAAATGAITINDGGDAGQLSVEGTVLDINSLYFIGSGEITAAANQNLSIFPAGTGDLLVGTDTDSQLILSGIGSTIDIATGTNERLVIKPAGTGDTFFQLDDDTNFVFDLTGTAGALSFVNLGYNSAKTLAAGASTTGLTIDLSTNLTIDAAGNTQTGLSISTTDGGNLATAYAIDITGSPDIDIDLSRGERIVNNTNGQIELLGAGGTNDAGLVIDLDGAVAAIPTLSGGINNLIDINDGLFVGVDGSFAETIGNTGFVVADGNDLFVAGMAGIEGNVYTDGSFTAGSSSTFGDGFITDSGGDFVFTLNGASDDLNIINGNIKLGSGTPDSALDGEDLFIGGNLEIDGSSQLDGSLTINLSDGEGVSISGDASPTFDILTLGAGDTITSDGVDELSIVNNITNANSAGLRFVPSYALTNGTNTTMSVIDIDGFTAFIDDDNPGAEILTLSGLNLDSVTESVGDNGIVLSAAVRIGDGWDSLLQTTDNSSNITIPVGGTLTFRDAHEYELMTLTADGTFNTGSLNLTGGLSVADDITFNFITNGTNDENLTITQTHGQDLGLSVIDLTFTDSAVLSTAINYLLELNNADDGGATGTPDAFVFLNQADTNEVVADGILYDVAAGALTDAIDASDAEITNALNAGNNFIDLDGIRLYESATGTLTFEDTVGNDLMTLVDNSNAGDMTLTGDIAINGGNITSVGALDINPTGNLTISLTGSENTSIQNLTATTDLLNITGTVPATNDSVDGLAISHTLTDSDESAGLRLTVTNTDDNTAVDDVYGMIITIDDNSTLQDDRSYGLYIDSPDNGVDDPDMVADAFIVLANNDSSAGDVVTDGILFDSQNGPILDAIDASHTNIINAINVGHNIIKGLGAAIDFSEFDVAATTGAITINDDTDAGSITIEGSVLDINSLDFTGVGAITSTGAALAITGGTTVDIGSTGANDINLTPGNANNLVEIISGNLKVGNGSNDVTLNGEDAYIEGTLEVDGAARFDTSISLLDGNQLIFGNGSDAVISWDGAGDYILINNTNAVGSSIFKLGSATNTTDFQIIDSASNQLLTVYGDGTTTLDSPTTSGTLLGIDADIETGTIIGAAFSGAATLSNDLTGLNLNLSSNVSYPANINGVDTKGIVLSLPAITETAGGVASVNGIDLSSGTLSTSLVGAGEIYWNGILINAPGSTKNGGTLGVTGVRVNNGVTENGQAIGLDVRTSSITNYGTQTAISLRTSTIPTAGTQTGLEIIGTGVAAGNLYGINIDNLTGSTGTEKALQIGTGWDIGLTTYSGLAFGSQIAISGATPVVNSGAHYYLTQTGATNVTNFNANFSGQLIFVEIGDGNTTFDCTSSNLNCGTNDIVAAAGDIFTWLYDGSQWNLLSFMDASDNHNTGDGFDLAEYFQSNDSLSSGDVVEIDPTTSAYVKLSDGETYDNMLVGVVSTDPGEILGDSSLPNSYPIALVGRVPVNVTNENGSISAGDPLTSSSTPGYAMKATEVGKILGYALENFSETSGQVLAIVQPEWYVGSVMETNGVATIFSDDLVINTQEIATAATPSVASQVFSIRGSAWNGSTAEILDMKIQTEVTDAADYRLSFKNTTDAEVAYLTNEGTLILSGDLITTGRIYPSDRGVAQASKYIFYDGSAGPGGDMMRTNASGWATGSYDFAEMFPSTQSLEPGDVVAFTGDIEQIGLATGTYNQKLAGIVSTRPGFLAGENSDGHFPVALAGRVPTKVNLEGGTIAVGDPLTSSSTAGYAMKAEKNGMIIGYALEPFTGNENDNKIVVFVSTGYFNGKPDEQIPGLANSASLVSTGATANFTQLNLEGGIFMGGNDIINTGRISGLTNLWSIEEDGTIKTESTIKTIITSYQNEKVETTAITSANGAFITLVGTSELQSGMAAVIFEEIEPKFNDVISTTTPIRVVVTPNGPVSLYVSEKNNNGFMINQISGSDSGISVDWMVTAYRKDYEPESPSQKVEEVEEIMLTADETETIESEPEAEQKVEPETEAETDEVLTEAPAVSPLEPSDPTVSDDGGIETEPSVTASASEDSSAQTGE